MRINHFLNVRNLDLRELPIRITDVCPLLVDEMLNVSEFKTNSISDCQKLLALIEQSVQTVKKRDAEAARSGLDVIFVESRRNPYISRLCIANRNL